jgi:protein phosphatase
VPIRRPTDQQNLAWIGGSLRVAGATDVGCVRSVNQDAFARFDDVGRGEILLVVADGLGGHRGGEVASRLAVDILGEQVFDGQGGPADRLVRAIRLANERILVAASQDEDLKGMGTTVVCLLLTKAGDSQVAHVGDSRLYRLRSGHLDPMTEDHSLVATLVRERMLSEDEARDDPRRNQILRALGVRDEVDVEVTPVEPEPGDSYLLCSDGLHGLLTDIEIGDITDVDKQPEKIVADLIAAALEAGGHDNVTCLLARLPESTLLPSIRELASRLRSATRSWLRVLPDR